MASQEALIKKFQVEIKDKTFLSHFCFNQTQATSKFLKVKEKFGEMIIRNPSKANIHLKS